MDIPSTILLIIEILLAIIVVGIVFVILIENRNPQKTISWILVLICLPVVGIIFYLFFGQEHWRKRKLMKRMHRRLYEKNIPSLNSNYVTYPPEYDRLISMFTNINDSPVLTGTKIDFYTDGKDQFKQLFEDIGNAMYHIHILYYKIIDDEIGNELKRLLISKVRQGVEVRLIYDDVGSIRTGKKYFHEMKKEGIEVISFLEVKLPKLARRVNYRNHRKIVIIDGKIGYTGGMNVADCYINGFSWGKWKDMQIRMEGNGVKGLQKVFLTDWYFSGKPALHSNSYFPEMPDDGNNPLQIVSSGPTDGYNSIEKGILQAINLAKKSIYIQTPYFIPSEIILSALQTAAISNISVHVMLPCKSDSYFVDRATHSYVRDLVEYGINVYLYEGGFLHTKCMVVDDELVSVGSANMDIRSFELSFETNAFIYDYETAKKAKDIFMDDARDSRQVISSVWRKRPVRRRFMEAVMRIFTPLF